MRNKIKIFTIIISPVIIGLFIYYTYLLSQQNKERQRCLDLARNIYDSEIKEYTDISTYYSAKWNYKDEICYYVKDISTASQQGSISMDTFVVDIFTNNIIKSSYYYDNLLMLGESKESMKKFVDYIFSK